MSVIEWNAVTKKFGRVQALDGFSLRVGAGVHCLLGANGAGKSTALSVLTGARRPDEGSVTVDGIVVRRGGMAARAVGSQPQSVSFPQTLKVREVVDFVGRHYPDRLSTTEVLAAVGLEHCADRLCGGLSGGETRRLGLACALVGRSRVVILDEPVAGLDRDGQELLHKLIRQRGEAGDVVIVSSHDLLEIESIADRLSLVAHGRVVATGSVDDIRGGLRWRRVEFDGDHDPTRAAVSQIDPNGTVEELRPGSGRPSRISVLTYDADAVARYVLETWSHPRINVREPSLAEAVDALASIGIER
ncbi:ABC transporter ATP-binding protein [Leifsonia soli]|uniref:ABC transporter ATP-binding protein n=1 Tax=Leifsonia soli TaxID=582665 RepID=UPI001C536577